MEKNKKILLIALILILAMVILLVVFWINSHRSLGDMPESIDGKTAENQLLLNGISVFSEKYTGTLKRVEITDRVSTIIKDYIPELHNDIKNLKDDGLEKYYNKNKIDIEERFGIVSLEDFTKFANSLNKTSVNLNDYYKLNIKTETFMDRYDKNYAYVECFVTYGEEETDQINFDLYVTVNNYTSPKYIIGIKE